MTEGVCLHKLVYDESNKPKDYKIVDINPAYTIITGLAKEKVINKLATEVYGTTEAPYLDIYAEIAINGKSTTFETYFPPMNKYFIISVSSLAEGIFATIFFDISDRKRANEALKKSEKLYRLVFANAPIGIMHYDKDGTITDLNDKFAEIIGAPQEEIIGFNMLRQLQDKQMLEAVQTALNGEIGYYEGDYLSVTAGKITPSRAIYNPIFSEQGEVVGGVSIFEDITERKQAEEALRESEARWKFALEGPGDGVWDWNIPTSKVFFSHQWKAMLGYTDEEIGDGLEEWDKRVHPDDKPGCYEDLKKHFKGKAPIYQNEHRLLCKDGTYKWILDRGKVMQWADDGRPARVIGIHTDITERKNVDQAFKTLMESTIASVGQEYFDLVVNKLCEWLQCEVAMVGKLVDNAKVKLLSMQVDGKLIYGNYYLLENTPCNDVYNKGFCIYSQRVQELFPLSQDLIDLKAEGYVGTPLRDKNNRVVGILCALSRTRLTLSPHTREVMHLMAVKTAAEIERLKLEQERANIEAQLRQAQKMEGIGTLAGGIAHDFNNILMAILGYTEMSLMEIPSQSKSKQYLEQVRKASYRAKELVDQILTFSRKQEGARTPLEISLIIKEALKLLRASLPTTIEIKQLINSQGNVIGDPIQVHQILMNLCTNAFHAMPKGGLLEISLEDVEISSQDIIDLAPGPHVKLQIKDSGEGIDPSIQERIFEPYFTTKEVGKGSGMGLAVVMGIVKSHGGNITVNSELGHGSTFTIYIPRAEVEIARTREEQSTDVGHETGRILFVDDEDTIADFIKAALEMMGYEVVVSTNSVAALELFRAQSDRFDLVITDLTMPKLTGVDLAQQLTRIKPGIPIILCTGYKDKFTKDDVKNLGVSDIIIKPIGIKDLGAAVQKVLQENKEKINYPA
jgi:PAS domain S-box-containing protein